MGRHVAVLSLVAALGCAFAPPRPPTAVIDASPDTLCGPDEYTTAIVLSAARSASGLAVVPTPPEPDAPLTFEWRIEGAEHEVVGGTLDAREVTVITAGDRPLHAWLTVRDEAGGVAESLRSVAIIETDRDCDDGCPRGMVCAADRCVPEGTCVDDSDCCSCFVCEAGTCAAEPRP